MALFHTINSLAGHVFEGQFNVTFNLASSVVIGDVGKPVTLDTTTGNTVKVAGDGDVIFGRLETFEDRQTGKVGAVAFKFIQNFPVKSGDLLAVGDTAVGSTVSGEIKKAGANNHSQNFVVAIASGVATLAKV